MKALTWQGKRTVSVEDVPDPKIIEPTDAIIRVTSTAICGSDLHLYEVLGPFMDKGDVIGHEPMGIVDAVGGIAQAATGLLPSPLGRAAMENAGLDRLSGVYGGMKDPMPMMTLFDKQIQMRMGQCNVRNWTDDILPLVDDPSDPLGVLDLKTHTAPLDDAPAMYEKFQKKEDGCIKVVLKP